MQSSLSLYSAGHRGRGPGKFWAVSVAFCQGLGREFWTLSNVVM